MSLQSDLSVKEICESKGEQNPETDPGPSDSKKTKPSVFQKKWLKEWPWLSKNELGAMICDYCGQNKMSNSFTGGGCNNFHTSTLSRHAQTSDHQLSLIAKTKSQTTIEASVSNLVSNEELAVKSAIDTVYWLCKENIAIEKYGSLLKLLEKEGCTSVKNLDVGGNATYRSRSLAEDIQEAIANTIMAQIIGDLKDAYCVAILIDENTDISVTGKLTVYVKFVDNDFNVRSHFLGNFDLGEKGADDITQKLLAIFNDLDTDVKQILCFGSDGASVMTRSVNGVAAQLRRSSPFLINIHCVAHRLAICTSQSAAKIDLMQHYKSTLTNLFYYFKGSSVRSSRLARLQELLNQPHSKVREMHDIRWFSFYNVLEAMYKSWNSLVVYFQSTELSKDPKATSLLKSITNFKFAALTWSLMDVIPVITELNLVMQKDSLDVASLKPLVASTVHKLQYLKENDGHYTQEFQSLLTDNNHLYGHELKYNKQQEAAVKSAMTTFLGKLIENLNTIFPSESVTVISSFDVLAFRDLSFVPETNLQSHDKEKLDVLISHYGSHKGDVPALINAGSARQEFDLLKRLLIQQKHPRDKFHELWRINDSCHKDLFPNFLKLACIGLTLPVQTAICERGFSSQNIIKTSHRNKLSEKALRELMTISIEGPPVSTFDARKALEEFKTKKQRRIFQRFSFNM
ncbi:zinc finger protein 862-like [Haliotis asinina]|uniref:zinc finger protein 862-like n=1 Tax=Haliotis asinina TaxID=109174 RepID=UPI003531E31D